MLAKRSSVNFSCQWMWLDAGFIEWVQYTLRYKVTQLCLGSVVSETSKFVSQRSLNIVFGPRKRQDALSSKSLATICRCLRYCLGKFKELRNSSETRFRLYIISHSHLTCDWCETIYKSFGVEGFANGWWSSVNNFFPFTVVIYKRCYKNIVNRYFFLSV